MPRVDRAIWGRDRIERARRRWTSSARPCPQCPMRTHLGPAAQLGRRLQGWGDTATAPGRWSHPGQRSYWRAPALTPLPTRGHTWSAPEGRAWGRLWGWRDACDVGALPPQCPGSGGPSGAEIVLGRAPTVGRPHHPGHTRSAPEGRASDEDQLRGRDRERRILCSDGICGGGERELRAAGALPIRWMPRVVGRPLEGTDGCRCG